MNPELEATKPEFKLYLFGPPRIERDGRAVEISVRKDLALLIYLAVSKQAHSRDALATLLWPESDAQTSRASLRRALHRLKKNLGEGLIAVDLETLRLNPAVVFWLDIEAYQQRVSECSTHDRLIEELSPDCLAQLAEAAALYTDDFLAGFTLQDSPAFDDWQFFEGESLRQSLAQLLSRLALAHKSKRDYEQAILYARRWLAIDPLHEPAHRELMKLYAQSGQQAAAIRQYQDCARQLFEELGVEPEAETTALYEAIRSRQLNPPEADGGKSSTAHTATASYPAQTQPSLTQVEIPHNLPSQLTPIIGREPELGEIKALLLENASCRLLTLTGPGGSGKTRLAIQAGLDLAAEQNQAFSDGIWFIPLAPLTEAESIPSSIAKTLDVCFFSEQDQRQQILDFLHSKRMLLLLDNFEHLLNPESTRLITAILGAAPWVKMLITSRERLNVHGEQRIPVTGLRIPPRGTPVFSLADEMDFSAYSAIQLFQQCAKRQRTDFEISAENLPDIVRICQAVQGMPLGIELAATWLDLLSPAEIASEIERSLDFLEAEWQDVPERQRNLRAVFDSSWQLLTSEERLVLSSLTIFHGSFSREAAQAIAGASLKNLLMLVNKSWLQRETENRYQIHELLRQYGSEKLQAEPALWRQIRDKHSAYYKDYLEEQFIAMKGPGQKEAFNAVASEFENIRSAWYWLVEQGQLETAVQRLLPAIFRFAETRAKTFEILRLLDPLRLNLAARERESEDSLLSAITLTAASAFFPNGYPVRFDTFDYLIPTDEIPVQQAWSTALRLNCLQEMGFWGTMLAYLYGRLLNLEEGIAALRGLLPHLHQEERRWELGFALQLLGGLLFLRSKKSAEDESLWKEADQRLSEALAIFQELGDERESGCTLWLLGNVRLQERSLQEAILNLRTAQVKLKEAGEWFISVLIDWKLGDIHLHLGEFETAFHYYRSNSQAQAQMGDQRNAAYGLAKESLEALRYSDLDHALQTRQQSLALSQEAGDLFGEAWSSWEMGETYRVAGDPAAARQWYDRAQILFEKIKEPNSTIYTQRGLGDLAQAAGDYEEAQRRFQASLQKAREANHDWGVAYALNGLGRAATGLSQFDSARQCFLEALEIAQKVFNPGLALVSLAGLARLFARTGEHERAVELSAFILNHHASWRETKADAASILAAASAHLPEPAASSAQETGRTKELADIVAEVLDE